MAKANIQFNPSRPEQDVKLLRRPSDVKQALGSVRPLGDGVAAMLDGYSS